MPRLVLPVAEVWFWERRLYAFEPVVQRGAGPGAGVRRRTVGLVGVVFSRQIGSISISVIQRAESPTVIEEG
jgi:hypothetical protein